MLDYEYNIEFHWKQNICGPSNFILNKLVLQQRGIAKSLKVKGKYCLNLFSKVPLILGNDTNFDILCSIIVCTFYFFFQKHKRRVPPAFISWSMKSFQKIQDIGNIYKNSDQYSFVNSSLLPKKRDPISLISSTVKWMNHLPRITVMIFKHHT